MLYFLSSMETHCSYIPYHQTGYFSKLVTDYLNNAPQLQSFYNLPPTIEGLKQSIKARQNFTHRKALVETLQKQYEALQVHEKVSANFQLLLNENTFTVTTAHQSNIFTGPLYVVYKIFHAIKLAEELKQQLPHYNFVPVYFMGSEDADLEELNHITINQRKYVWPTKQTGAVGRMKVDKQLMQLMNEMEGQLSVLPYGNEFMELLRDGYKEKSTLQQASLSVLNALFGGYGLIILIPDNVAFKKLFQVVLEKELKEQFSYKAVRATAQKLEEHYKVQASGRAVNLFYLIDDKRERIELEDGKFKVAGLQLEWTQDEILKELDEHAERFSPNVILRGVLQETILPNIAFIGGGGELAYWLELKDVFKEAGVPYPVLLLRNSFLWIEKKNADKIKRMQFSEQDLFKDEHLLLKVYTEKHSENKTDLDGEFAEAAYLYNKISAAACKIDTTLIQHINALKTKTLNGLVELEKKMLRAEKKKFVVEQQQINKIKSELFPGNSLQERVENVAGFYAVHGKSFLSNIYLHSKTLQQQFAIITSA